MDGRYRRGLVAVVIACMAYGVLGAAAEQPPSRVPAPRFKARDLTGRVLDLSKLLHRGPIVLDFWATWCSPCVEALPELQALQRKYDDAGLTVIGVSVDGPRNFARVRPFTASMGLTYPIVLDSDGRLQQLYHVIAIPTAFVIDTTGTITYVRVAYRPGEGAKLEHGVRALLADSSGP